MELKIEFENEIIFEGSAEEYLEQNEYDAELEEFLSEFEVKFEIKIESEFVILFMYKLNKYIH